MSMIIFFTIPPMQFRWPWILVNQFNVFQERIEIEWSSEDSIKIQTDSYGWRYLLTHRSSELILLDSGVEKLFKRPNPPTDYPPQYEQLWIRNVERLIKLFGKDRVIVTIPDYPDDYVSVWGKPHALWKNGKDNIERTVENIVYYWDKYCTKLNIKCLIPVQGHFESPTSISKSIKLIHEYGILREGEMFGIANLCTTKRPSVITDTIRIARSLLGDKWIHVFGPSLASVKDLARYVDSFDTTVSHSRRKLWLAGYLNIGYRDIMHLSAVEIEKLTFVKSLENAVRKLRPEFKCSDVYRCVEEAISVFKSITRDLSHSTLERFMNKTGDRSPA